MGLLARFLLQIQRFYVSFGALSVCVCVFGSSQREVCRVIIVVSVVREAVMWVKWRGNLLVQEGVGARQEEFGHR